MDETWNINFTFCYPVLFILSLKAFHVLKNNPSLTTIFDM